MSNRDPKTVRCDNDLWDRFTEFAIETDGQKHGAVSSHLENALSEYLDNGRDARIERKLDDILEQVEGVPSQDRRERERRKSQSDNTSSDQNESGPESPISPTTPRTQTDKRIRSIVADLPENTSVSEAILDAPIEANAGSDPKTLRKYKRLLQKRGHIFAHPFEAEQFFTSATTYALFLENDERVDTSMLDELLGHYDELLGEDWYLDALPDDYILGQSLRYDDVPDLDSREYREAHGLTDDLDGYGVQ